MADRPQTKHARLIERAARNAGAIGVTWKYGKKHTIMLIELPGDVTIVQPIPRGLTREHTWWENYTRQKIQRALKGANDDVS